jgi:hypothetical protein
MIITGSSVGSSAGWVAPDNWDVAESDEASYDESERAYLLAVSDGQSDRHRLGTLATAARDAAREWARAAYERFFSARDVGLVTGQQLTEMEIFAEKGELLAELWDDIARAQEGRYHAPT